MVLLLDVTLVAQFHEALACHDKALFGDGVADGETGKSEHELGDGDDVEDDDGFLHRVVGVG